MEYDIPRDTESVERYSRDSRLIMYCKRNFLKYMPTNDIKNFIYYLLTGRSDSGQVLILKDQTTGSKKFHQHHKSMFDKDNRLKPEKFNEYRNLVFKFIHDTSEKENIFLSGFKKSEVCEGDVCDDFYWINKDATFELFRKNIIDESSNNIKYDFKNPDMEISEVSSVSTLQRVYIDVITPSIKYPFITENVYNCPLCNTTTIKKSYDVVCTDGSYHCQGDYTYTNAEGDLKTKICRYWLKKSDEGKNTLMDAYVVDISYVSNGERHNAQGTCFFPLQPGKYEAVIYYTANAGKMQTIYIVDVKKPETNKLELPVQTEENYLFTLQRYFDSYIEKQTGVKIFGLYPIKAAMILQRVAFSLNEKLMFNVMIVGDASTGKSLILKYYSYLLNHYYNMSTNGLSISIPALRGTRSSINLFGKDYKIVTIGHLGTYHSIHIDEVGEAEELVQNLKTFLLESNYSYDKAGGNGISNKRTAHVNLSQNLNPEHLGAYRGAIRKAYKDLNMTIDGVEKEEWDENWDLFLPIHQYTNPQLRKIVREKRSELIQKQKWWIDGLDYALHERFPFYFYLVTNKPSQELEETINLNSSRKFIEENSEIARVLYTEDMDNFFNTLKDYIHSPDDQKAFHKVSEITKEYGFMFDSRQKVMFNMIVRLSRIINKRMEYKEEDYNIIRWFLENTNVKLDVADTNTYTIQGPPDKIVKDEQQKVEEESKSLDDSFGLPQGEF